MQHKLAAFILFLASLAALLYVFISYTLTEIISNETLKVTAIFSAVVSGSCVFTFVMFQNEINSKKPDSEKNSLSRKIRDIVEIIFWW